VAVALALVLVVVALALTPSWLPRVVVALRMRLFARINGPDGLPVPGELVDVTRFLEVYGHPAAKGRSRGAALSDLFWYWLSPGPEVHQEHLEPGPRYDAVARCTRRIIGIPSAVARLLAVDSVEAALPARTGLVRTRQLVMPVWAELYHRLVFDRPATDEVRALIVGNADDVVTALKCCGLRHMDRRLRLTAHLEAVLDEVPHELPEPFDRHEQALYLQGTFFNTAIVQSSEATAHLLMVLARDPDRQRSAIKDDDVLDAAFEETLNQYPLFGVAHRITTAEVRLGDGHTIPEGSVLCFNYPEYHQAGGHIPFGVTANRPCPAAHLAPVTVKAVTREVLTRYEVTTAASHTRALPNGGPCVLRPREGGGRPHPMTLPYLHARDRWEDVGRSLTQLVLGTYMVWDARRQRLCEHYFEELPRKER
jgi:hypothetical protein